MTQLTNLEKIEKIQKSIFDLSVNADDVITSYGSLNDVRSALLQIRQNSLRLYEVISSIELEKELNNPKEEYEGSDIPSPPIEDICHKSCSKDDDRVIIFLSGCKKIYADYMAREFPIMAHEEFRITQGKRYIKVIRGGSVHCFVDRTNGDVLKAASWSAPAKHARGNIWNDDNGLDCMNEYGAAYLRG